MEVRSKVDTGCTLPVRPNHVGRDPTTPKLNDQDSFVRLHDIETQTIGELILRTIECLFLPQPFYDITTVVVNYEPIY